MPCCARRSGECPGIKISRPRSTPAVSRKDVERYWIIVIYAPCVQYSWHNPARRNLCTLLHDSDIISTTVYTNSRRSWLTGISWRLVILSPALADTRGGFPQVT